MALIFVLVTALLLAAPLRAETFVVTKTSDDDGSCTADDCALREAILAANARPGPDRVEVPSGTYQLSLIGSVPENSGLTGDLDILDAIELEGVGGHATIVGDGTDRVMHFIGLYEYIVSNVIVTGGVTTNSGGGIRASGVLSLRNSIVHGNKSGFDAGGIFLLVQGRASITNTTIADNRTERGRGGGLLGWTLWPAWVVLEMRNVTVSQNHAPWGGGGAALKGSGAAEIVNSTFADNSTEGSLGEALFVDGTDVAIRNSLFANNDCGPLWTPTLNGHNMEGPTATCFVPGEDAMGIPDLMLGPLADNGGPTPTHALLPGSPAIDAALDADCPPEDQRGVSRPQDGRLGGGATCDIGAFELSGPADVVEVPTIGDSGRMALIVLALAAGITLIRRRNAS